MKLLTSTLIFLPCTLISFGGVDAFVLVSTRTTFKSRTNPLYYIEIENDEPESFITTRTEPVWIERTFMDRVVKCTDGECDVEELDMLVKNLHKLDEEECLFVKPEEEDCVKEATARETVKRVLLLRSELAHLEPELVENHFIDSVKKQREEKHSGHWFQDYMHMYHM